MKAKSIGKRLYYLQNLKELLIFDNFPLYYVDANITGLITESNIFTLSMEDGNWSVMNIIWVCCRHYYI